MRQHGERVGAAPGPVGGPDPVRGPQDGESARCLHAGAVLRGVVLDLMPPPDALRVMLVGENGTPLMSFGPYGEEEVIAVWRSLAQTTGLVPMIRGSDGRIVPVATQIGRLRVGRVRARRRLPLAGRARPRFLIRRKGASLPARPFVHHEPEMASGLGR